MYFGPIDNIMLMEAEVSDEAGNRVTECVEAKYHPNRQV